MERAERERLAAMWEDRVKQVAQTIHAHSEAGAVLVALFDGPWMEGAEPAVLGLAGRHGVDMFRLARDLRDAASMLEQQAGKIAAREPFEEAADRTPPVRQ